VKARVGNHGCQPSLVAPDIPVPVLMYHSVSDAPTTRHEPFPFAPPCLPHNFGTCGIRGSAD
jgi:hypothetical protein